MPKRDREFRRAADAAYQQELRERLATGKYSTVVGDDPVVVVIRAQIELTVDAVGHEQQRKGRPVDRVSLGKLLEFTVAHNYRLGWKMVAEKERRGRPAKATDVETLFRNKPAWMVDGTGVPQRVGTGAHRAGMGESRPGLVEAAMKHLGLSRERVGDLARQLADMAGQTPEGMIGKNLPDAN